MASWTAPVTRWGTLYQGRIGQWAFVLHRITGVAVFLFLVLHVLDTAVLRISPEAYNQIIGMYHRPIMAIGEAGLVAMVTLHGLNGIRVMLIDALPQGGRLQNVMFYGVVLVFLISMAIFLPVHFRHAFGAVETAAGGAGNNGLLPYGALALIVIPALRVPRVGATTGSNRELIGWVFMRISGLLLLILVAGHLITNLMMGSGVRQINFAFVAGKWSSPFWQTWSLLLLLLAIAHGANGVRTVVQDYVPRRWARFGLFTALYVLSGIVVIAGVLVIFTLDPCPPGVPFEILPSFCIPSF